MSTRKKYSCAAMVIGSLVLSAACVVWSATSAPADRPRPPSPPASASAPATAPAYPSRELSQATEAAAVAMKARLDDSFVVLTSAPFVVAGNLPRKDLQRLLSGSVERPAAAMWKSYFRKKPDQVITVLLLADEKSYRAWAKKLFDDDDVSYYGYYKPTERTLVMNIATGGGTLVHELTHALIVYDFPDVPTWFNEGLGSLHEQCSVLEDRIVGHENWRLGDLQEAIRDKTLRPLNEMLSADDFYENRRGMNYAQARYLVMYMQQKAALTKFYAYFHEHHEGSDAGIKAVEHVLGKKIDEVEKDLNAWVLKLRFDPR